MRCGCGSGGRLAEAVRQYILPTHLVEPSGSRSFDNLHICVVQAPLAVALAAMAPKGAKGASFGTPSVVVLCIVCFFAGRFISLPGSLPEAGKGVRASRHLPRLCLPRSAGAPYPCM